MLNKPRLSKLFQYSISILRAAAEAYFLVYFPQ